MYVEFKKVFPPRNDARRLKNLTKESMQKRWQDAGQISEKHKKPQEKIILIQI